MPTVQKQRVGAELSGQGVSGVTALPGSEIATLLPKLTAQLVALLFHGCCGTPSAAVKSRRGRRECHAGAESGGYPPRVPSVLSFLNQRFKWGRQLLH